jgi:hypothetical protein
MPKREQLLAHLSKQSQNHQRNKHLRRYRKDFNINYIQEEKPAQQPVKEAAPTKKEEPKQ